MDAMIDEAAGRRDSSLTSVPRGRIMGRMRIFKNLLIVLCCLLLAAHFSRSGNGFIAVFCLALPLLLCTGQRLAARILQIGLLLGGLEWLRTLVRLASRRIEAGDNWVRMAMILGTVAALTFVGAWLVGVPADDRDAEPSST